MGRSVPGSVLSPQEVWLQWVRSPQSLPPCPVASPHSHTTCHPETETSNRRLAESRACHTVLSVLFWFFSLPKTQLPGRTLSTHPTPLPNTFHHASTVKSSSCLHEWKCLNWNASWKHIVIFPSSMLGKGRNIRAQWWWQGGEGEVLPNKNCGGRGNVWGSPVGVGAGVHCKGTAGYRSSGVWWGHGQEGREGGKQMQAGQTGSLGRGWGGKGTCSRWGIHGARHRLGAVPGVCVGGVWGRAMGWQGVGWGQGQAPKGKLG